MKRLILAGCVSGAMLLGVAVVPAGAATIHGFSPSVAAKLAHAKAGHKLTAAQLRRDKAGALRLIKALRSHKAHAAAFPYVGSAYSDALDPVFLTDTDLNPTGGVQSTANCPVPFGSRQIVPGGPFRLCNNGFAPGRYAGANANAGCFMTTAFTFSRFVLGQGLSCIALRTDAYEDTSTGNIVGFQLLCPAYDLQADRPDVVAKDNNVYGPASNGQLGCYYTTTYWFAVSSSLLPTQVYGLFTYQ